MRNRFSKKAFTLVELLIVVVIIGILATAIIPRFGSARAAARNGVRQNDLSSLASAIDLYYSVENELPDEPNASGSAHCVSAITELTADYISKLPVDPSGETVDGTCDYYYDVFDSDDGQYMLLSDAETETDAADDNKGCTADILAVTTSAAAAANLAAANACGSNNVVYGVVR